MGKLDGKVAFITGAARVQGRAHAIRMADEGAQVVICDIASQIPSVTYPMATPHDMARTTKLVGEIGNRCLSITADARDPEAMDSAVAQSVQEFGRLDIAVINHGIATVAGWDAPQQTVDDIIDVNIRGTFNASRSAVRRLVAQGKGGSIVLTASVAGIRPMSGLTAYTMSKHAVIGLMRALSADLATHRIRVNAICPGTVDTPMMINDTVLSMFSGMPSGGTRESADFAARGLNLLPEPYTHDIDIAYAALFLASEGARSVTGHAMVVDNGMANQPPGVPPIAAAALAATRSQS